MSSYPKQMLASVLMLALMINCAMESKITYVQNPDMESIRPDYKGNIRIDGRYFSSAEKEKPPMGEVIKWKLSRNPQRREKKADLFSLQVKQARDLNTTSHDMIVWLGHASFFIRQNGITMITDPCFYNIGYLKRKAIMPYSLEDLPDIDYILVSHAHRDHFDLASVAEIIKCNPTAELLLPLSTSSLLKKELRNVQYQEAGWYQKYKTKSGIEIFFLPAKHWNRRGLFDYNKTLWGSFMIKSKGKHVFFAGDTALSNHFEELSAFFPLPDICLIPIGAYKPEYLMQREHLSPIEAVEAFNRLKGKVLIPMHFGTYDLSDEPLGEPSRLMEQLQHKIQGELKILTIGQPYRY